MFEEVEVPDIKAWARILDAHVVELIRAEQPPEGGEGLWLDVTQTQPPVEVGMHYADDVFRVPRWARVVNGVVIDVTLQLTAPEGWIECAGGAVGPGWIHDGEAFDAPPSVAVRHISVLAFRNRFVLSEKIALEIAGLDDPAAEMPARVQAAALRASQQDVMSANYIDLDRADTRAGVLGLEAATILGVGRALEILDSPIQPHEVYRP
ncbi:MAG: hypothetical protein KF796_19680 [Ramlibacter sp.]|nr:hypothetical protein [Ramlibacter sp.]